MTRNGHVAACAYFRQTHEQLLGVDALGVRGYSPKRRAAFKLRFNAWLAGELNPFVLAWPPGADGEKFLVIPQHVFHAGRASVALVLIPTQLISAAIGERASAGGDRGLSSFQREKDGDLAKLTRREWDVARRLAEGDRVPLIVEDLGIAENTVRNHLKAIFRKLGVGSQAELIRRIKRPPGVARQR